MTDSGDFQVDQAGISRRQILKKSALIGGTALWVAPTVLTITALPAFASESQPGDGSLLCADFYLMLFRCGGAYYLVKVMKDPQDHTKLKIVPARDLFIEDDRWHAQPGHKNKQTRVGQLRKQYSIHLEAPSSVTFYTSQGGLCVDVGRIRVPDPVVPPTHHHRHHHHKPSPTPTPSPTYHFENACAIAFWFVQRGNIKGTPFTAPELGPVPPDADTPQVSCFSCPT
jgi:hypothetical protein